MMMMMLMMMMMMLMMMMVISWICLNQGWSQGIDQRTHHRTTIPEIRFDIGGGCYRYVHKHDFSKCVALIGTV
jgi:hypothetical protein